MWLKEVRSKRGVNTDAAYEPVTDTIAVYRNTIQVLYKLKLCKKQIDFAHFCSLTTLAKWFMVFFQFLSNEM